MDNDGAVIFRFGKIKDGRVASHPPTYTIYACASLIKFIHGMSAQTHFPCTRSWTQPPTQQPPLKGSEGSVDGLQDSRSFVQAWLMDLSCRRPREPEDLLPRTAGSIGRAFVILE